MQTLYGIPGFGDRPLLHAAWREAEPVETIMRHITMTGIDAGLPICGVNRVEATKRGDQFHHAGRWLDNPELVEETCPQCRKLWDEAGEDDQDT